MIPSETFWAYVAGFFDGEGCMGIRLGSPSSKGSLYWKIDQSGKRGKFTLDKIAEVLNTSCGLNGKARVRRVYVRPNNLIKKPKNPHKYYTLRITHRESVLYVIDKIIGYLNVKKTVAQDVWRFCCVFPRSDPGEKRRAENRCARGHLYAGNSYTYRTPNGKLRRQCKTCKKFSDRAYHQSKKKTAVVSGIH